MPPLPFPDMPRTRAIVARGADSNDTQPLCNRFTQGA